MQLGIASGIVGGLMIGYFLYYNLKTGFTSEERKSVFTAIAVGAGLWGAHELLDADNRWWNTLTQELDAQAERSPFIK